MPTDRTLAAAVPSAPDQQTEIVYDATEAISGASLATRGVSELLQTSPSASSPLEIAAPTTINRPLIRIARSRL